MVLVCLLSLICMQAFPGFVIDLCDRVIEAQPVGPTTPLLYNAECGVGQRIGSSSSRSAMQRGKYTARRSPAFSLWSRNVCCDGARVCTANFYCRVDVGAPFSPSAVHAHKSPTKALIKRSKRSDLNPGQSIWTQIQEKKQYHHHQHHNKGGGTPAIVILQWKNKSVRCGTDCDE
jgi:hypothetical protein